MSKLDRIMKQIEDGTYRVSSEKIAEKLLKKNPNLADTVCMETKLVGQIAKGLEVASYMDEGCTHLFQFDYEHNNVPYGSYLIGLYEDGSAVVLSNIGDQFMDFDDDDEMSEEFEDKLFEKILELGLA